MRRQTIIDVVPVNRNGEVIYMETDLRGLGAAQAPAVVNTATNITNVASAAAAAIPTKQVTAQSDFSKGAYVVATTASTIAAAAVVFFPAGTVVAAIAGVVAAAAALLGKIFANSKGKAYAAERGEYEKVNAELKYENYQLDLQYQQLYPAIQELKGIISSLNGIPDATLNGGLGLCLWDCKEEGAKLQTVKEEFDSLKAQQENKTNLIASLLDEYNKLLKAGFELKAQKSTKDWLLWIMLGVVVIGGGYYLYKKT
ncbi:MAG TPA: hypothetical protein VK589_30095 [Chryseolinea sp.]|nr:hypothetical protein [Chryseolinea sp.]